MTITEQLESLTVIEEAEEALQKDLYVVGPFGKHRAVEEIERYEEARQQDLPYL